MNDIPPPRLPPNIHVTYSFSAKDIKRNRELNKKLNEEWQKEMEE